MDTNRAPIADRNGRKNIDDTISDLSIGREYSKGFYFLIVLIYLATSTILSLVARSGGFIRIGSYQAPISSFTGIFSSLANICVIFLVVFYKKTGYVTSIVVILLQFPMIVINIVTRHNLINISGFFNNLLTLIAITIIYINSKRLETFQQGIRTQAVTDRLTGLPNRFACYELMSQLVSSKTRFAFVSIDLNNFKNINDTMGHAAGNDLLCAIAQRWRSIADSHATGTLDFLTRQGGDEFALIIRDYKNTDDLLKTIRYYASILESKITIDNYDYYISASFGYTEFPIDSTKIDSLFSFADAAMYQVKSDNSGNHIMRFTPELLKEEYTLEKEHKIREALDNNHVFFYLQPQFDMAHKLRGFEALARMKDMQGNPISPAEFIPVAEKAGLIDKVDSRVFKKAAEYFGGLIKRTGTDIILSVNVSVRHLMKNDYLIEVRDVLKMNNIPPRQLEIEITESIMLDSAGRALQTVNELRNMGVRVAIDDFGTGYSSLSNLKNLPCNTLKIDKSFIDEVNSGDPSRQYVSAIISIGHIMNLEVISEGVETEDQLNTLREIGCDCIQGFFWGRPMPCEAADKLL